MRFTARGVRTGVHFLNNKESRDQQSARITKLNSIDAIGIKLGIAANDRDRFYLSLGNEQAIKRISVMPRQTGTNFRIIHGDW